MRDSLTNRCTGSSAWASGNRIPPCYYALAPFGSFAYGFSTVL